MGQKNRSWKRLTRSESPPTDLLLGGKRYKPNEDFSRGTIRNQTLARSPFSQPWNERLNMPGDLVGKLGIRFDYATQGLTGLMGIQVDPYFGRGHDDERSVYKSGQSR